MAAYGEERECGLPPLARFGYEHDYGSPTELDLEYSAVFGEPVQAVSPSQPWHGGRIVILARNNPRQACLRCGQPAHWKAAPEYDELEEYDDELYDDEGVLCADDLGPHHLLRGVCAGSRGTGPAAQLSPGGRELLRQRLLVGKLAPGGFR